MPLTMHTVLRAPDRYRFLKGKIVGITNEKVTIQPYGGTEQVEAFFDPQVTYFWKGGLTHTKTVTGSVGNQGTATTFRDNNGRLLVETLMINHEQVRGKVTKVTADTLIGVQPTYAPK